MQVSAGRAEDPALSREAALVRRATGEPEAFARLYDAYVDRVYRYAFRRLHDHAEAEDLTAQTFRRALERLPQYEWRGLPFGAWLFRIAHNLLVDRRRGTATPLSLDGLTEHGAEIVAGDGADAADAVELREELDAAWAAVATLPPLQRRAIVLRFGQDRSHAEVGVLIGRSEAATKQIIYRAIKTLRVKLEVER
jgi:RNA polymerase sigma-70 factor (ECF subfamily)